jgi:hypothetical protein
MDVLITWITLVVASTLAIGATAAAIVGFCRGDGIGKTLKTWIRRLIDVITGLG